MVEVVSQLQWLGSSSVAMVGSLISCNGWVVAQLQWLGGPVVYQLQWLGSLSVAMVE